MKKNYQVLLFLVMSLALAGVSCQSSAPPAANIAPPASAVEPAPAPPAAPAGPDQTLLNDLQAAIARAGEARKRAADFESPAYFPSEWEAAEAQYETAADLGRTSDVELRTAAEAYKALADTYDALFNKTILLYAQAREDEISEARDVLIATGLSAFASEYLRAADETALSALDQYEAKDYYKARDTAAKALGTYQTLKVAADAALARQEIVDKGFEDRDAENFGKGDMAALAAISAYEDGDLDDAKNNAEEALNRYNQALAAAWAAYAVDLEAAARKARQAALDLKANVAVKDTFNEAEGFYTRAAAALNAVSYREAAALYSEAETRFEQAGYAAAEKRRIAEDSIREAERRTKTSEETARQAEIVIQGGSI